MGTYIRLSNSRRLSWVKCAYILILSKYIIGREGAVRIEILPEARYILDSFWIVEQSNSDIAINDSKTPLSGPPTVAGLCMAGSLKGVFPNSNFPIKPIKVKKNAIHRKKAAA